MKNENGLGQTVAAREASAEEERRRGKVPIGNLNAHIRTKSIGYVFVDRVSGDV